MGYIDAMNVKQLAKKFGNQTKAAKYLGVRRATVSVWKTRGIPLIRQFEIERMTKGKLRADRP